MRPSPIDDIAVQLQTVTELISLPEIYLRFRRVMQDETADIHDFADVVRLDPNLSMSTLKIVNSAYFGFSEKVDSISQAVNMIGIGQLHQMVLGLSAIEALDLPNDILPLKSFWRSSLFSGVLSSQLARRLKIRQAEQLFIMGLLHEIGHLVLYARFPELAGASRQLADKLNIAIHLAEQRVVGCHYGDIGAMLMAHWGLSEELQRATRCQPTPAQADSRETALLHLAHAYARQETSGQSEPAESLIDPVAWELAGLCADDIGEVLVDAQSASADMEKILKL